jgi:hypothetical protein
MRGHMCLCINIIKLITLAHEQYVEKKMNLQNDNAAREAYLHLD